jgi:hypothetical protein
MYLQNKYTRVYNSIIERAKSRETSNYTEKHHIIPKSLGGDDRDNNIVKLTPREHFICHRLLPRMLEGESKRKMTYALKIMTCDRHGLRFKPNSRILNYIKEQARQSQIGVPLSEERKAKIKQKRSLQKTSEVTREKMRKAHTGRVHSEETKLKISKSTKGRIISEEQKEKIREARKKQVIETIQITCPHCGKTGGNRIMPRYHFDNCRLK